MYGVCKCVIATMNVALRPFGFASDLLISAKQRSKAPDRLMSITSASASDLVSKLLLYFVLPSNIFFPSNNNVPAEADAMASDSLEDLNGSRPMLDADALEMKLT